MSLQSQTTSRVQAQLPVIDDSYHYEPLPEGHVRWILLLPGPPSESVYIQLSTCGLQKDLEIQCTEALSYTWGPPTPGKRVHCSSGLNSGYLPVTPNLYDALAVLRWEHQPRFLWVDQICINQRDNLEKGHQVQLMGQIYSKAERVLVWMGKEVFWCKNLIEHLSTMIGIFNKMGGVQHFAERRQISEVVPGSLSKISEECWAAMKLIFSRPYFTRIWMIQEVTMGREVFVTVDGGAVSWPVIEAIGMMLWRPGSLGSLPLPPEMRNNNLKCFATMRTVRRRLLVSTLQNDSITWPNLGRWCLLDLVEKAFAFQATDPRDKVYALAGLLRFEDQCIPQDIFPDYSPGVTYQELVRKATITAFTTERCLASFIRCNPGRRVTSPSWLLDVDDPHTETIIGPLGLDYYQFSASAGSTSDVHIVPNDETALLFKVTWIGEINKVAEQACWKKEALWEMAEKEYAIANPFETDELYQLVLSSYQAIHPPLRENFTFKDQDIVMDFGRAFLCNFPFEDKWSEKHRDTKSIGAPESAVFKKILLEGRMLSAYLHLLIPVCSRAYGMRFFQAVTKHQGKEDAASLAPQLMGWIPKEGVAGDALAVIHGFRMPMLLRRIPSAEERYRFLGICYVHGFMDGQAKEDGKGLREDYVFVA
jgi:hypothetical protein